jgi:hypothetical protein
MFLRFLLLFFLLLLLLPPILLVSGPFLLLVYDAVLGEEAYASGAHAVGVCDKKKFFKGRDLQDFLKSYGYDENVRKQLTY